MTPKLQSALAALDDARSDLIDVVEAGVPAFSANQIDAARQLINAAVIHIQTAEKEPS